jgi:hypothetical protein
MDDDAGNAVRGRRGPARWGFRRSKPGLHLATRDQTSRRLQGKAPEVFVEDGFDPTPDSMRARGCSSRGEVTM